MASSRRTGTNESKWTVPGGAGSWTAGVNTFGTAGAGRDYTALSLWETDTDVDLVTATVSPVIECYADASSYTLASLTINGATSDASYRRILRAASTARHNGVPGVGVKFVQTNFTGDYNWFTWSEAYGHLQDVQVECNANSTYTTRAVLSNGNQNLEFVGLLVKGTESGSGTFNGIYSSDAAGKVFANCIIYECNGYGIAAPNTATRILNNTVVNCGGYGFADAGTEPIFKNNIGYNNTSGDWQSTGTTGTTHNLSKDATAPGTTNYRNKTLTFVDAANDDYRLAASDTDAIGQGTDLSADTWAFDDDIAFTVRS